MKIYATLRYEDAAAAHDWLERAFGLEPHARHEGEEGRIEHAQMRWGTDLIMFGSVNDGPFGDGAGTSRLYLSCDDPDALFERVSAAGAEVVRPLEDMDYGSREFSVRDPEGNLWSFGTYEPT